jgi:hypothetical protein
VHAYLLCTLIARTHRGRGRGTAVVARAGDGAAKAGCEWMLVDWDHELDRFYRQACGFTQNVRRSPKAALNGRATTTWLDAAEPTGVRTANRAATAVARTADYGMGRQ